MLDLIELRHILLKTQIFFQEVIIKQSIVQHKMTVWHIFSALQFWSDSV